MGGLGGKGIRGLLGSWLVDRLSVRLSLWSVLGLVGLGGKRGRKRICWLGLGRLGLSSLNKDIS